MRFSTVAATLLMATSGVLAEQLQILLWNRPDFQAGDGVTAAGNPVNCNIGEHCYLGAVNADKVDRWASLLSLSTIYQTLTKKKKTVPRFPKAMFAFSSVAMRMADALRDMMSFNASRAIRKSFFLTDDV
jgi:hypothetical protein